MDGGAAFLSVGDFTLPFVSDAVSGRRSRCIRVGDSGSIRFIANTNLVPFDIEVVMIVAGERLRVD